MALKFRLRDLAETFLEFIRCPHCGATDSDDTYFSTEMSRVTYEGIVVVAECKRCGEIFVPKEQRLGILNPLALKIAVQRDSLESGEPLLQDLAAVELSVEHLNAARRGDIH